MGQREKKKDSLEKAKVITQKAVKTLGGLAANTVEAAHGTVKAAVDRVSAAAEEKRAVAESKRQEYLEAALLPLQGTEAEKFLDALGESPLELTDARMDQIKKTFPLPREQNVVWADAEFDLRPSGIAITDKGVFIRTNVAMMDGKKGVAKSILKEMDEEEQEAYLQHHKQFHSGKSVLLFYSWDNFDAGWFVSESEMENNALLVEPQCSERFVDTCRSITQESVCDLTDAIEMDDIPNETFQTTVKTGAVAGAAVETAQSAIFPEQKAHVNTPAGHGEMAEEANNILDRLHGLNAKVVGRDNAKDGADRQIGDIFIQSKYYNSARGSLEACFSPENGQYRYMRDGEPMQLEVPKDQYEKVLEGFRKKIEDGKVPGVTNPDEAVRIVRKGRLTYQQAVNLTKPGTIESLVFDAMTGAVICSCAFGLTFVVTAFLAWRETGDVKKAVQAGVSAGLQVFGISFVQHMVASQIARTGLAKSLLVPSQYIAEKLGYHASATIVNGIRALSGKGAIYGAAASKHLAKMLRSNVLTSVISFTAFAIPDTYNMFARKMSGAQYAKNMSVLAGSIAAGAGGTVAAGLATGKVTGAAATAVAPGVGTAVGIAGGFVGGAVGSAAVKVVGNVLHEDDAEKWGRMFNAYVSCMIGEYLLNEDEVDTLISQFDKIKPKEFKTLFESLGKADEQENLVREFLNPYFEAVVSKREHFELPSPENMEEAIAELMQEDDETHSDS